LTKVLRRREEAHKAAELQFQMSAEAKTMVTKLAVRTIKHALLQCKTNSIELNEINITFLGQLAKPR